MLGRDFAGVLAAARRGDELAFARLWRDLQPALLRYFMRWVPTALTISLPRFGWLRRAGSMGSPATRLHAGRGCSRSRADGWSTGGGSLPGVSEHLDLVRAAFAAAFGMWTPLPQILERCLHDVYERVERPADAADLVVNGY